MFSICLFLPVSKTLVCKGYCVNGCVFCCHRALYVTSISGVTHKTCQIEVNHVIAHRQMMDNKTDCSSVTYLPQNTNIDHYSLVALTEIMWFWCLMHV